ncbi:MAG: RecQ family ATP-dependent DNA helicase [Rhodospirillaceae bacterium]
MRKRRLPQAHGIRKTMRKVFGHAEFRPGQEDVIMSVLEGRDTLAIMPTGAGKSLCYQLPALYLPGTTIVVSPLISLMKDQADKLDEAGVAAAQVNSTLSDSDERLELKRIAGERREIVFTTPERLADPDFIAALKRNTIDLFVVDEAHCISQWGHDFRPAFLEIGAALKALGDPPLLALTATATENVVEDVRTQLGRPNMRVLNTGVYRPNLRYAVTHVTNDDEKLTRINALLARNPGSGIIYCATIKNAEAVYESLREAGASVTRYHGKLAARERRENQDAYMSGACRVMVATNAFGLGVDKPDIRFIVHYQVPGSIEAYYQESGRAGRDGEPALCALLYDLRDRRVQQFFLGGRYPGPEEISAVLEGLHGSADGGATIPELKARLPGVGVNKLRVVLSLLNDAGMARGNRDRRYTLTDRAASEDVAQLAKSYRERAEADREKLERMMFYAQTTFCRWKVILEYFGEAEGFDRCGTCDNCLRPAAERYAASEAADRKPRTKRRKTPRFDAGATVTVPRYGEGRVVSTVADQVEIAFPNGETRTFLASYVERLTS